MSPSTEKQALDLKSCLLPPIQPFMAAIRLPVQKCPLTGGIKKSIQEILSRSFKRETLSPEPGKEASEQMCTQMGLVWFPAPCCPHPAGSPEKER